MIPIVGLVVGQHTRTVYMRIDADRDEELDNPHWLKINTEDGEPVRMLKLLRNEYEDALNIPLGLQALIAARW